MGRFQGVAVSKYVCLGQISCKIKELDNQVKNPKLNVHEVNFFYYIPGNRGVMLPTIVSLRIQTVDKNFSACPLDFSLIYPALLKVPDFQENSPFLTAKPSQRMSVR